MLKNLKQYELATLSTQYNIPVLYACPCIADLKKLRRTNISQIQLLHTKDTTRKKKKTVTY